MSETLLFVYGSLRPSANIPAHSHTPGFSGALARLRHLSPARTAGRLYRVADWYPAMVPAGEPGEIVIGDVFAVPDELAFWEALDAFEETTPSPRAPDGEYRREKIMVRLPDSQVVEAWTYFYNLPVREEDRIRSGDFFKSTN